VAPLVPYQKSYYILLLIRFQLLHSLRFLVQLSCPVDAVNPIAKISPKKKEKNAKVKTSGISLVYFYLKIDRKFPFFYLIFFLKTGQMPQKEKEWNRISVNALSLLCSI
jgi:hypothetical protein